MYRVVALIRRRSFLISAFALAAAFPLARANGQQTIYWSDFDQQVVHSSPISGAGAGTISTASDSDAAFLGIFVNTSNEVFAAAYNSNEIFQFAPSGGGPPSPPGIIYPVTSPTGIAVDGFGNIYAVETGTADDIAKFTFDGTGEFGISSYTKSTFVTASAAPAGQTFTPYSLAFDPHGNLYEGDQAGNVYKIAPNGLSMSVFVPGVSGTNEPYGMAFNPQGDLFVSDFLGGTIKEYSSAGASLGTVATGLNHPMGLAFDANGNLWEASQGDGTADGSGSINKFSLSGSTWTELSFLTGLEQPSYVAFPGSGVVGGIGWTGLGTTGATSWSDPNNWAGGVVPGVAGATNATASNTDTALFNTYNSSNPAPVVDSGRNLQFITFDNTGGNLTSSITLGTTGGNALLLTNGGYIQMNYSVANPQTINAPLVLEGTGGTYLFTNNASAAAATLNFGGGITAGAASGTTTLTLSGSNTGANTISGAIGNGSSGATFALSLTSGDWTLSGANTYSGGTAVSAGVLTVANSTGSGTGSGSVAVSGGSLVVTGSLSGTVNVTGGSATINGSVGGSLNVTTGSAVVGGSVAGTVTITSGTVTVNGSVAGPVIVNGGTLAGTGMINGALSVNNGGTLAPGAANNLTVNNAAGLASGSILSYTLSTPGVANAGTLGGNTLTTVNGALTLNPGETVNITRGSAFGIGTYVLAHYTSLVNNSNGFSGWTINGPNSNIYNLQVDPANSDIELVARPLAPAAVQQNLFVAVNGNVNGGFNSGSGVTGNSIIEYAGATGSPIIYSNTTAPIGLGFDSNGNLFATNNSSGVLEKIPAGGTTPIAPVGVPGSSNSYAYGLAVDPGNDVFVANQSNGTYSSITKYTAPALTQTTGFFHVTTQGYGLASDSQGDIWTSNTSNGTIQEFPPSGGSTPTLSIGSGMTTPFGLAFDAAGDLYVADKGSGKIWKFAYNSPGNYTQSLFYNLGAGTEPFGVAVNASGDVFVSNFTSTGAIYEFSPSGTMIGGAPIETGLTYPTFLTLSAGTGAIPAWTGASDNTWANTGNWSTGVVPGSTSTGPYTDTSTALFNQPVTNMPAVIDANRNVMNITFDTANVPSITVGASSGTLLLTDTGTTQITSTVVNPQTFACPLVLEGTAGALTNSYSFINNSTTSTATFTFGGGITSGASIGVTTLSLSGANAGTNTISGAITDGGNGSSLALSVTGSTWQLTAASNYSGGTSIANGATLVLANSTGSAMKNSMNVANAGSLVVATANQIVGTVTGAGNTVVNAGASLTAYQIRQNSLTVGSGALVTLTASGSGSTTNPAGSNNINFSSNVTSLNIAGTLNAWTGTLDIGNNGLVVAYGNSPDPYSTINNMIESGYNGGVWGGKGITSTLAQAGVTLHISTPLNIGLLDFTPGTGNYSNTTFIVFEGQTVTTNAILVRLTYMDDLVLAGDMASNDATSDALLFAANYGTGTTWGVGDLVHNGGPINSSDALLFAANYVVGLPSLDGTTGNNVALGSASELGSAIAAVPEPASAVLAGLAALGLGVSARGRRRRS